ncbi:LysM peptidoglycan-binding domain-containing protein [Wenzhouxiangella sp. XN24]|uniref:LysM peptidoglycan-binding domain-containing protein n=1 Tax=Wenzhouxiangella sp. XN24 TaxID=2713569 RepID=UPI0013EDDCF4|nr:LysM peptidoglycan-binding domain-containing protein [Wenzhouxiangella sp. XN24]NGX16985.1 LysM peptidoglycan-binding domain-containing protein [Wenzhouxiangella sp. XN24]
MASPEAHGRRAGLGQRLTGLGQRLTGLRQLAGLGQRLAGMLLAVSLAACAVPRDTMQDDALEAANATSDAALLSTVAADRQLAVADPSPAITPSSGVAPTEVAPTEDALPPAPAIEPPPADLLARLRDGFALPPVSHPKVATQVEWFARNPAYLERVLERARPYLAHVAAEIEARGLPGELAFLPVIESAYDPFAYSHGRAAGLWQIVPATGTHIGLRRNWWYDGRRDVVDSTQAALNYLESLHERFDGDWLLALAAYNGGQGRVGRAIDKNLRAGRPATFWDLSLPRETRNYVPRLLGLAAVLADPDAHGLSLPLIPPEPVFTTIELDGQIDLAVAAELAELELAALQAFNPGFNRWATDPAGPHRLHLPVERAAPFAAALAALPAAERVRWQRHEVRPGDTLGGIAQRYKTTVAVLQSVNGLSGTNIRLGAHLMIPTSTRSINDYPLSADNRLADTQQRNRPGRTRLTHTVRNGESLWVISRRHGVGVRELAAWNGMAPGDTLSVGRELVVWARGDGRSAAAGAATGAAAGAVPQAQPTIRRVHYTVRRGDSLSRIASNFSVSVADIRRWNQLDRDRYLQPGQRLVLHVDVTAQSGG